MRPINTAREGTSTTMRLSRCDGALLGCSVLPRSSCMRHAFDRALHQRHKPLNEGLFCFWLGSSGCERCAVACRYSSSPVPLDVTNPTNPKWQTTRSAFQMLWLVQMHPSFFPILTPEQLQLGTGLVRAALGFLSANSPLGRDYFHNCHLTRMYCPFIQYLTRLGYSVQVS